MNDLLPQIMLGLFVLGIISDTIFKPAHKILDHVNFLSGALGTGKTSVAVALAVQVAKRRKVPIVSNIRIDGAEPMDCGLGIWPQHPCVIILDEILLLESNEMLPYPWLAAGLTMARQYRQTVILLNQSHRPPFPKKFWGTIGQWAVINGISFGSFGRLVWIRRSPDPFTRSKGFKGNLVSRSAIWVKPSIFAMYDTPAQIHGISRVEGRLLMTDTQTDYNPHSKRRARRSGGAAGAAPTGVQPRPQHRPQLDDFDFELTFD